MPAAKNSTFRYAALVVLVLGLVAGLTWVTQFLPNWRVDARTKPAPKTGSARAVVQFSRPPGLIDDTLQAVWDPDPGYALENERLHEGHCYFPFRNVLGAPAELEMDSADCDCTHAHACLLSAEEWKKVDDAWRQAPWKPLPFTKEPNWVRLNKLEHSGFKIPADGQGLLRITWNGRKGYGEPLNLSLKFWSQPDGDMEGRHITPIKVPVRVVPALMYDPPQLMVGIIGPGQSATAEFYLWSATRSDPAVSFVPPGTPDPLFTVEAQKLTEAECKTLQEVVKKKMLTRVKCGYRVKVTLSEEKDGRQMDVGPFTRSVPIFLDKVPLDIGSPQILGTVRGPVTVGGDADQGKVQFHTFSAADRKSVVVPVYADAAIKLEVADHYPPLLQIDFKKNAKGSTPQRTQWDLKVTATPGAIMGPFPPDSRVVLRMVGETPRLVRIPIVGTGTR